VKVLVLNYTFDASAKQVTLTDYNPVVIERLLMITNTTDGIIIYQFNDPEKGGTASTNIVTLEYDTASMDDSDKLQIFYDDNATTLPVSGTITATVDTSLLATSAKQLADGHSVALSATDNAVLDDIALNQTDASQKTQVVDGSGNVIGATLNALDINIKSGNPTTIAVTQGTATSLKSQAEVYQGGSAVAIGNPLEVTLPVATVTTLTPPAAITGFATETTLSAINAKMVTGTDIGDVTVNNGAGAAAVNIQDGGNTITVDGTVAVTNSDITSCKTALELLDNSVDGNYLNVNMNVAGTDVDGNNGTASAQTLRVTIASDSTGVVGHNITGIGHGVKTVTTAGTDVALATSTPCKRVTIQAQTDNTSLIAVGGSGVDATIATGTGVILYPGDVFELDIDNLADVYIDSLVNGEGVRFTYFT